MGFDRRQFLTASSTLVIAGVLGPAVRVFGRQAAPPTPTSFKALRGGVGIFTGRGGTIGWFVGADAVAVIDSQYPDTAQSCIDGLKGRTTHVIDTLINTHHHADHTSGNKAFKGVAGHIVAQAKVPALQKTAAIAAKTEADQVYADVTFADTWKQDLGTETVHAKYYGPAHTSGDAVIFFEKANIVHMGDLVFNHLHPYIDRPAGASIANWITVTDKVAREHGADTIFIFGHGNENVGVTGTAKDLTIFGGYLAAALDRVNAGVKAGKSREEITKVEDLPGFEDYTWPGRRMTLSTVLDVAWQEVTGAK